jgi:hypothetical protein
VRGRSRAASAISARFPMKTYIYVDGFNLYYRAVKRTPYKWLDIDALSRFLLPKATIERINYYTAIKERRHT